MSLPLKTCPICNNLIEKSTLDLANIYFLQERAKEGKLNASLSLAKIVWENIPQLRHITESELLDGLVKTMMKNFQQETNKILEPIKFTIETLPRLLEGLPDGLKSSIQAEFDESRAILERQFKTIIDFSPKPTELLNSIQAAFEQLNQANKIRLTEIEQDLAMRFKGTLEKMGFPEPEQMKLLSQLIPITLPLLEELVRFQKIPGEKGKQGELELFQELHDYYPEDDCEHLGGPGDTDILAIPRFNGSNLTYKILIESKKNGSGWNRSFIQQTRNHMKLRGERFAILAVDNMPKGANGFLFEQCPEGVVLVTDREYFRIAYGSIRASLIALQPFGHKEVDFSRLFADQKISEAIKEAYDYCEWVKRIKEKARRIETNIDGIGQDIDELDKHQKRALSELQTRINNAIAQISPTECNGPSPNHQKTLEVSISGK